MDRPLKLWEFVSGLVGMMLTFCAIVYNCGTISGKTEVRLANVEIKAEENKKKVDDLQVSVDGKMDKIGDDITVIKVLMQDKQDRKR